MRRCLPRFSAPRREFPAAPWQIAAAAHVPVVLCIGLFRGGNRYDVHFARLFDELRIDRRQRDEQLRAAVQHFADRLEQHVRLAPYNWFNFYDFWNDPRLAAIALAMTAGTAHPAELDVNALVARLARPAPDTTSFVEVRYSQLLETPLVVAGRARASRRTARWCAGSSRRTRRSRNCRARTCGGARRHQAAGFSLDRAPELRGMLASFGALLEGDRAQLDRYFVVAAPGTETHWQLTLSPRDAKLQRRLAAIAVEGGGDHARCFTLAEPDHDEPACWRSASRRADLPQPLERQSLAAWCAEAPGRLSRDARPKGRVARRVDRDRRGPRLGRRSPARRSARTCACSCRPRGRPRNA